VAGGAEDPLKTHRRDVIVAPPAAAPDVPVGIVAYAVGEARREVREQFGIAHADAAAVDIEHQPSVRRRLSAKLRPSRTDSPM